MIYNDKDLLKCTEQEIRTIRGNNIAMIFQEPLTALNPLHTTEKQIGEVLRIHNGLKGKAARKRIIELLELVGIPNPEQRLKSYRTSFPAANVSGL